jgi:hypothetical protein
MPFKDVFDPSDLALLTRVVDEHCTKHAIPLGSAERDAAATMAMSMFSRGARSYAELQAGLAELELRRPATMAAAAG